MRGPSRLLGVRADLATAACLLALTCSLPLCGEDVATALARPVSPGSVALLVEHTKDPAVAERLGAALKDARPEVRAAAARVVNVSGLKALVPDLRNALASETDRRAGVEEIWGLAALGTPAEDEPILSAAERLGPAIVGTAALILARTRGAEVVRHLPRLTDETRAHVNWSSFIELATRGEAAALGTASSALFDNGNTSSRRAFLEAARKDGLRVESARLMAALHGDKAEMRAAVYLHLAALRAAGEDLPDDLLTALKPMLDDRVPPEPLEAFSREVLRRALGLQADEKGPWMASLADGTLKLPGVSAGGLTGIFVYFNKEEIKASGIDEKFARSQPKKPPTDTATPKPLSPVRTVGGFPEGLVSDLLQITRCRPSADLASGGATISYGYDGRPRRITVVESGLLGPECSAAARVLVVTALAPEDSMTRPEPREVLILPFRPEFIACLVEASPPPAVDPSRVSESVKPTSRRITEPRKLRDVKPTYPKAARDARQQGIVLLEAQITPTGCVASLRLLEGVTPTLDWEAVHAVSGWQYTPTLLDGRPVPVIMTVTVNFRLH